MVRRERREPQTFTLRMELVESKPVIWRTVQVPSTLMLDQVHSLVQVLFGWLDCHLHQFVLGESVFDPEGQVFLCPFDVEEGEDEGQPEVEVRLDETLADVGDVLHYLYDYGDTWVHRITLEQAVPGRCTAPLFLDGEYEAPEEDSGGISEWQLPTPLQVKILEVGFKEWAAHATS